MAGTQYLYSAEFKAFGSSSAVSNTTATCTTPKEVTDLQVSFSNSSHLTVSWTIPAGVVEAFVVQANSFIAETNMNQTVINVTVGLDDYSIDIPTLEDESCFNVLVMTLVYCDHWLLHNISSPGRQIKACTSESSDLRQ